MSLRFFIQWYQWVQDGTWNWSEFDVIQVSFERDTVAGDWGLTLCLLGFGCYFHYVTKASAEKWAEVLDGLSDEEKDEAIEKGK